MKTELEIKRILRHSLSTDAKVKQITRFMNWDEKKLIKAIEKHGTSSEERRSKIINEFWPKKNGK